MGGFLSCTSTDFLRYTNEYDLMILGLQSYIKVFTVHLEWVRSLCSG